MPNFFEDIYLVKPNEDGDPIDKPDKKGFFKSVQVGTNMYGKPIFVDFTDETVFQNYVDNVKDFKTKVDTYYNLWSNNNSYLNELQKIGNNSFSNFDAESRSLTTPENLDEKIKSESNLFNRLYDTYHSIDSKKEISVNDPMFDVSVIDEKPNTAKSKVSLIADDDSKRMDFLYNNYPDLYEEVKNIPFDKRENYYWDKTRYDILDRQFGTGLSGMYNRILNNAINVLPLSVSKSFGLKKNDLYDVIKEIKREKAGEVKLQLPWDTDEQMKRRFGELPSPGITGMINPFVNFYQSVLNLGINISNTLLNSNIPEYKPVNYKPFDNVFDKSLNYVSEVLGGLAVLGNNMNTVNAALKGKGGKYLLNSLGFSLDPLIENSNMVLENKISPELAALNVMTSAASGTLFAYNPFKFNFKHPFRSVLGRFAYVTTVPVTPNILNQYGQTGDVDMNHVIEESLIIALLEGKAMPNHLKEAFRIKNAVNESYINDFSNLLREKIPGYSQYEGMIMNRIFSGEDPQKVFEDFIHEGKINNISLGEQFIMENPEMFEKAKNIIKEKYPDVEIIEVPSLIVNNDVKRGKIDMQITKDGVKSTVTVNVNEGTLNTVGHETGHHFIELNKLNETVKSIVDNFEESFADYLGNQLIDKLQDKSYLSKFFNNLKNLKSDIKVKLDIAGISDKARFISNYFIEGKKLSDFNNSDKSLIPEYKFQFVGPKGKFHSDVLSQGKELFQEGKTFVNQDDNSFYRGQFEKPHIDKSGNLVIVPLEDNLYRKLKDFKKGVSLSDKLDDAVEYGLGQLEVRKNISMDSYDRETELNKLDENGFYIIQIDKSSFKGKNIIKEQNEFKVSSIDNIVIPKGKFKIEHIVNGETVSKYQTRYKILDEVTDYNKITLRDKDILKSKYTNVPFKFDFQYTLDRKYLDKVDRILNFTKPVIDIIKSEFLQRNPNEAIDIKNPKFYRFLFDFFDYNLLVKTDKTNVIFNSFENAFGKSVDSDNIREIFKPFGYKTSVKEIGFDGKLVYGYLDYLLDKYKSDTLVINQGVPGTGKTYSEIRFADMLENTIILSVPMLQEGHYYKISDFIRKSNPERNVIVNLNVNDPEITIKNGIDRITKEGRIVPFDVVFNLLYKIDSSYLEGFKNFKPTTKTSFNVSFSNQLNFINDSAVKKLAGKFMLDFVENPDGILIPLFDLYNPSKFRKLYNTVINHKNSIKNEQLRQIYTDTLPEYTRLKEVFDRFLFEFGRSGEQHRELTKEQTKRADETSSIPRLSDPISKGELSRRISEITDKTSVHEDREPFTNSKFQSSSPDKPYKLKYDEFWNSIPDKVTFHTNLEQLKKNKHYSKAKSGDLASAVYLVRDICLPERIRNIKGCNEGAIVVPLLALEELGQNRIPLGYAKHLHDYFGFRLSTNIVQINATHHTGKDFITRLFRKPQFQSFDATDKNFIDKLKYFTFTESGEPVINFGFHKGKLVKDLPPDYVLWLVKQNFLTNDVLTQIKNLVRNKYLKNKDGDKAQLEPVDNSVFKKSLQLRFNDGVVVGGKYVIVDDVITSGVSLIALKKFIEKRGGIVVDVSTVSFAGGRFGSSADLKPTTDILNSLALKFKIHELEKLLYEFNVIDNIYELSNSQAKYFYKFKSLDSIRDKFTSAGYERSRSWDDRNKPERSQLFEDKGTSDRSGELSRKFDEKAGNLQGSISTSKNAIPESLKEPFQQKPPDKVSDVNVDYRKVSVNEHISPTVAEDNKNIFSSLKDKIGKLKGNTELYNFFHYIYQRHLSSGHSLKYMIDKLKKYYNLSIKDGNNAYLKYRVYPFIVPRIKSWIDGEGRYIYDENGKKKIIGESLFSILESQDLLNLYSGDYEKKLRLLSGTDFNKFRELKRSPVNLLASYMTNKSVLERILKGQKQTISEETAINNIKAIEELFPEIGKTYSKIQNLTSDLFRLLKDYYGEEKIDEMIKESPDYASLERTFEKTNNLNVEEGSFNVPNRTINKSKNPLKKSLGSEYFDYESPIVSLQKNVYNIINAYERNNLVKSAVDLTLQYQNKFNVTLAALTYMNSRQLGPDLIEKLNREKIYNRHGDFRFLQLRNLDIENYFDVHILDLELKTVRDKIQGNISHFNVLTAYIHQKLLLDKYASMKIQSQKEPYFNKFSSKEILDADRNFKYIEENVRFIEKLYPSVIESYQVISEFIKQIESGNHSPVLSKETLNKLLEKKFKHVVLNDQNVPIMNFGKYLDLPVRDVPAEYLEWMQKNNVVFPEVMKQIYKIKNGEDYDPAFLGKTQSEFSVEFLNQFRTFADNISVKLDVEGKSSEDFSMSDMVGPLMDYIDKIKFRLSIFNKVFENEVSNIKFLIEYPASEFKDQPEFYKGGEELNTYAKDIETRLERLKLHRQNINPKSFSSFFNNGVEYIYKTDPQISESLGTFNNPTFNNAYRVFAKWNQDVVKNLTALSPSFIGKNMAMDWWTGFINTGQIPLLAAAKGWYHILTNSFLYEKFKSQGGKGSTFIISNKDDLKKSYEKLSSETYKNEYKKSLNPVYWLSLIGEFVEQGPRVARFVNLEQKSDMSDLAKLLDSKEVTVDFQRFGSANYVRFINDLIFPFFNARLQGLDRFMRTVNSSLNPASVDFTPAKLMRFISSSIPIVLAGLVFKYFNDKDPKFAGILKDFKNIYWYIPRVFTGTDEFIKIPKGDTGFFLSSILEDILDKEDIGTIIEQSMINLMPTGELSSLPLNPLLKIPIEMTVGKNIFANKNINSYFFNQYQYPEYYRKLSDFTGIDVGKIEHVVNNFTVGFGLDVRSLYDIIFHNESISLSNYPVLRRYIHDDSQYNQKIKDFFEAYNKSKQAYYEVTKMIELDNYNGIIEYFNEPENLNAYISYSAMEEIKKDVEDVYNKFSMVEMSRKITVDEKVIRLDDTLKKIDDKSGRLNDTHSLMKTFERIALQKFGIPFKFNPNSYVYNSPSLNDIHQFIDNYEYSTWKYGKTNEMIQDNRSKADSFRQFSEKYFSLFFISNNPY